MNARDQRSLSSRFEKLRKETLPDNRRAKAIKIRNARQLKEALRKKAEQGDIYALALAYLVNELCEDTKTTKWVLTNDEDKEAVQETDSPNDRKH